MDSQMRPVRPKAQSAPAADRSRLAKSSSKFPIGVKICLIALGLLLVAGVAWWFLLRPTPIDKDLRQAVFLTNGQVYVGKLHDYGGPMPYMSDVYFLQEAPTPGEGEPPVNTQTLIRLDEAIHKPEDKLILNPNNILFIQNVADDGAFGQAIGGSR